MYSFTFPQKESKERVKGPPSKWLVYAATGLGVMMFLLTFWLSGLLALIGAGVSGWLLSLVVPAGWVPEWFNPVVVLLVLLSLQQTLMTFFVEKIHNRNNRILLERLENQKEEMPDLLEILRRMRESRPEDEDDDSPIGGTPNDNRPPYKH